MNKSLLAAAAMLSIGFQLGCSSGSSSANSTDLAAPAGYMKYMVAIADGTFDPSDASYTPPSADFIYIQTLNMTQDQMAARQQQATAYYATKFGADTTDPANAMRIAVLPFAVDPRSHYRALTVSGESVPPAGWELRDGGWLLVVLDPNGFDLGGGFPGVHAPAGLVAAYGDYVLMAPSGPVRIGFQADEPYGFTADGDVLFNCALNSGPLGTGHAQGVTHQTQLTNGMEQIAISNVLTFPGIATN